MKKYKLGFIGLGKMGYAILKGVISNNVYQEKDICFYDINEENNNKIRNEYQISLLKDEIDVLNNSEKVILAFKPQSFNAFLEKAKDKKYDCVVISIAAGIRIGKIKAALGDLKYIRLMPNTPMMIGYGSVGITRSDNVDDKTYADVKKMFASISKMVDVTEDEIDIVVSASGSMPAYLYTFAKAFIEEAVKKGLSEDKAKALVCESIIGSCHMITDSNKDIDTLIKDVCSPKGTTLAGLEVLKDNDFEEIIKKCFDACYDRSIELGK